MNEETGGKNALVNFYSRVDDFDSEVVNFNTAFDNFGYVVNDFATKVDKRMGGENKKSKQICFKNE